MRWPESSIYVCVYKLFINVFFLLVFHLFLLLDIFSRSASVWCFSRFSFANENAWKSIHTLSESNGKGKIEPNKMTNLLNRRQICSVLFLSCAIRFRLIFHVLCGRFVSTVFVENEKFEQTTQLYISQRNLHFLLGIAIFYIT